MEKVPETPPRVLLVMSENGSAESKTIPLLQLPETPPRAPVLSENTNFESRTTTPELKQKASENSRNPGNELRKPTTPDMLKVPKAFKYPERYRSPTDMMVSPITKGLLARARRGGALLPPSLDQLKVQDMFTQDKGLFP